MRITPFNGYLEGKPIPCCFCGATSETRPERHFVTDGRACICSTCVEAAEQLVVAAEVERRPSLHAF